MKLVLGDITQISADAIVNAANTQLRHGGGVAAAIVRVGGQIVQDESDKIGWCDIGKAAVTGAGNLPAKCVIHIPTIDYKTGKRADLDDIKKGMLSALEIAKNTNCKKVAFPLLGAGVVGLPVEDVAKAMKEAADSIPEIESILVIRSQTDYGSLKNFFNRL
ncbi:MAG TPA: macro domain-containing protein [Candidatus Nanoarchaeia archaeon]